MTHRATMIRLGKAVAARPPIADSGDDSLGKDEMRDVGTPRDALTGPGFDPSVGDEVPGHRTGWASIAAILYHCYFVSLLLCMFAIFNCKCFISFASTLLHHTS